jgi:hypothetical protein
MEERGMYTQGIQRSERALFHGLQVDESVLVSALKWSSDWRNEYEPLGTCITTHLCGKVRLHAVHHGSGGNTEYDHAKR